MKSYKNLEIYSLSYDLAIKIHKMSLKLPKYETYEEGSQIRRSSKGITSCIVEGYGRRKYKADFVKFLVYAHASCDETNGKEMEVLLNAYDELGGKINRFIQYVEKEWK